MALHRRELVTAKNRLNLAQGVVATFSSLYKELLPVYKRLKGFTSTSVFAYAVTPAASTLFERVQLYLRGFENCSFEDFKNSSEYALPMAELKRSVYANIRARDTLSSVYPPHVSDDTLTDDLIFDEDDFAEVHVTDAKDASLGEDIIFAEETAMPHDSEILTDDLIFDEGDDSCFVDDKELLTDDITFFDEEGDTKKNIRGDDYKKKDKIREVLTDDLIFDEDDDLSYGG